MVGLSPAKLERWIINFKNMVNRRQVELAACHANTMHLLASESRTNSLDLNLAGIMLMSVGAEHALRQAQDKVHPQ